MWIWPLGPLLPFLKGPPNSSKTKIFKNNNFFCFTLSHWAYLPNIMFLSPKLRLLAIMGPLGHLRAPFKGPLNSSKMEIFKNNNFFCFTLSHWAYLPKIMFLSPKLRLLALMGPLGPLRSLFKGPQNSSKTEIFKNNNFFYFTLSHWAYLPKIIFISPKLRFLAL